MEENNTHVGMFETQVIKEQQWRKMSPYFPPLRVQVSHSFFKLFTEMYVFFIFSRFSGGRGSSSSDWTGQNGGDICYVHRTSKWRSVKGIHIVSKQQGATGCLKITDFGYQQARSSADFSFCVWVVRLSH